MIALLWKLMKNPAQYLKEDSSKKNLKKKNKFRSCRLKNSRMLSCLLRKSCQTNKQMLEILCCSRIYEKKSKGAHLNSLKEKWIHLQRKMIQTQNRRSKMEPTD
jgi:hypothetical protein